MMGAGPPGLQGSAPGDLTLYPEQIAAQQETRRLPDISAAAVVVAGNGQLVAQKNAHERRAMASTTKIMTALLVLERANLSDLATVPAAAMVGESTMGLQPGEVVTVEDLLWGLLLQSGNDAAVTLAEKVAGSETAFVTLMNQRAAELGLIDTHFANAHGLDAEQHYSSAVDLLRLTEEAMKHPLFRQMVASRTATAAGRVLTNINELLDRYIGADGVKTGTTQTAGQNLVASVTRDGSQSFAVVLGSDDRYADAAAIFDHYYSSFRWRSAPLPVGPTSWIRAPDGKPLRVTAPGAPSLFLPSWQWPLVRPHVVLAGIPTDLSQPAGVVRWYLGNQLLGEAPAVLLEY
jgi:D-alanyl-D-alanine carboxypeptidase (penicillin-binding protein 5/6)